MDTSSRIHRSLAVWDQFVAEMRDDYSDEATEKLRELAKQVIEKSDREDLDVLQAIFTAAIETTTVVEKRAPKLYTLRGEGLALSSVVVVRAESPEEAKTLAREWAAVWCVEPRSLEIVTASDDSPGSKILYAWNGDY